MRIALAGTGYVGLVTGTCLADMGHAVTCVDVDLDKIKALNRGEVPIFEPGLAELLARNRRAGRLRFTGDLTEALAGAAICFVTVDTPTRDDGGADGERVLAVARAVGDVLTAPLVLAVKSTVPVGTCEQVRDIVTARLAARQQSFGCQVVANPEFLKEGKAVEDCLRPDRIVVGSESAAATACMQELYAPFVLNGHPLLVTDLRSAEMSKYAANALLAARISLMNELADMCDAVGADITEVRRVVGTDPRIGMAYLYAGAGFGGSCLPKDLRALARRAAQDGVGADLVEAVLRVNERRQRSLAARIAAHFDGRLAGRIVAVWGLAFKPLTDDLREAPALALIRSLVGSGASVKAYDPEAAAKARQVLGQLDVELGDDMYAPLSGAEALVVMTEWGVFRTPDFARMKLLMRVPVIFDARNLYDPRAIEKLGFTYAGIGRRGQKEPQP